MPDDVYLIDGARTPQGRYAGALASVRPDDLAALVVGEAVRRSGIPADAVDEVILGADRHTAPPGSPQRHQRPHDRRTARDLRPAGTSAPAAAAHRPRPGVRGDIAEPLERGRDDALQGINSRLFERVRRLPMPTVAAVDGWALGGGADKKDRMTRYLAKRSRA